MVKLKIALVLIVFCVLLPSTYAIGIMYPKFGTITYQPNYEQEIPFVIRNFNYDVEVSKSGDFAQYATISPVFNLPDGTKQFNVKIQFPDHLNVEPGLHTISIKAAEVGKTAGMIGALTSAQKDIIIEVYSKEKDIEASFNAPNANQNEAMTFTIDVRSWSYQDIDFVYGEITIYDSAGKSVATLETQKEHLKSGEQKTLLAKFYTAPLKPGTYQAEASIFFDGKTKLLKDDFKIGTLIIQINDYTKEFTSGQIAEFKIEIESIWNAPIKGIYAELYLDGEKVLRTPSIDLEPWQKGVLATYWNVSLLPGTYDTTIKLYYEDVTAQKEINIRITSGAVALPDTVLKNPWKMATVILFAILAIFSIILLIRKHRKKGLAPE